MNEDRKERRRVKFYGLADVSTRWQVEQAARVLQDSNLTSTSYEIVDIIELHNAVLFTDSGVFPASFDDVQIAKLQALVGPAKRTVGRFFNSLDESALASTVDGLPREYHSDLLALFAKYKIYDRVTPTTALNVFDRLGIDLNELLTSQLLVKFADEQLRDRLLSDAGYAVLVIRKHLEGDRLQPVYLPKSFDSGDSRSLIERYLESDDANLNYISLVRLAPTSTSTGIDDKLRLKAKRRYDREVEIYFAENEGLRTGYYISIVEDQDEPSVVVHEGEDTRFTYGLEWLEGTLDYPSLLNNFVYLFEFVDGQMLLTLPSFTGELGAIERMLGVTGLRDYKTGAAYRFKRDVSTLQLNMYLHFLREKGIELEQVFSWFFQTYLQEQFNADHFRFAPSSSSSTYLERCRHLFSEMESVSKQFRLYVEDGELDPELLSVASHQVRYRELPSLLDQKYVYPSSDSDVLSILHLLFSDQSPLNYVHDGLQAEGAADLFTEHVVSYCDLHEYQKHQVDFLRSKGVLTDDDAHIKFVEPYQRIVLRSLFDREAVSYHHYPLEARQIIDDMMAAGWLVAESTLLSRAEASYFNYNLNQIEFTNGPDLRNKYSHGSQGKASDEDEHFRTYLCALKLIIALMIKINDDFCLRGEEGEHVEPLQGNGIGCD